MITRIIRILFKKIKSFFYFFYDLLTIKHFTCSVADLILSRGGGIDSRQFLSISRLLDIEAFEDKGDRTFSYQNSISKASKGQKYNYLFYNKNFEDLILSIKKNGYDSSSYLTIDKDLHLINGTHRVGMMLYLGINTVNVACCMRSNLVPNNIAPFLESGLDERLANNILCKFEKVNTKLLSNGYCFHFWIGLNDWEESISIFNLFSNHFSYFIISKIDESYSVAFSNNIIKGGFVASFIPNEPKYMVKEGTYYSQTVRDIINTLSIRFRKQHRNTPFLITDNCLVGYNFFCIVHKHITEQSKFSDKLYLIKWM